MRKAQGGWGQASPAGCLISASGIMVGRRPAAPRRISASCSVARVARTHSSLIDDPSKFSSTDAFDSVCATSIGNRKQR